MCGRFALAVNSNKIKAQFSVDELPELKSRYNIAPTQDVLFLTQINNENHVELFRWGLIPFFAKDKKVNPPLINARAETVFEKPAFRKCIQSKRGIIIMSGFYEWHEEQGKKQPYYFKQARGKYLGIAAIWDSWQAGGEVIRTCCLVTTEANDLGNRIHNRMPVILTKEEQALWMNNEDFNKELLAELMLPYKKRDLVCYPVTPLMNNSRFEAKTAVVPLKK